MLINSSHYAGADGSQSIRQLHCALLLHPYHHGDSTPENSQRSDACDHICICISSRGWEKWRVSIIFPHQSSFVRTVGVCKEPETPAVGLFSSKRTPSHNKRLNLRCLIHFIIKSSLIHAKEKHVNLPARGIGIRDRMKLIQLSLIKWQWPTLMSWYSWRRIVQSHIMLSAISVVSRFIASSRGYKIFTISFSFNRLLLPI